MREPPEPRKSKSNILPFCILKIQRLIKCHKLKRKWHTYSLKKTQYTGDKKSSITQHKTTNVTLQGKYGPYVATPTSGVRIEDMFNVPTALLPKSSRCKPLLLVSFPQGCDRSPVLKYLKKTSFARRMITRKKFRLKHFNLGIIGRRLKNRRLERKSTSENTDGVTMDTKENAESNVNTGILHTTVGPAMRQPMDTRRQDKLECVKTVRILKNHVAGDADIRVIFHDRNVIKMTNLAGDGEFPTEKLKGRKLVRMEEYRNLFKRNSAGVREDVVKTFTHAQEKQLRVYHYHGGTLISYSAEF